MRLDRGCWRFAKTTRSPGSPKPRRSGLDRLGSPSCKGVRQTLLASVLPHAAHLTAGVDLAAWLERAASAMDDPLGKPRTQLAAQVGHGALRVPRMLAAEATEHNGSLRARRPSAGEAEGARAGHREGGRTVRAGCARGHARKGVLAPHGADPRGGPKPNGGLGPRASGRYTTQAPSPKPQAPGPDARTPGLP